MAMATSCTSVRSCPAVTASARPMCRAGPAAGAGGASQHPPPRHYARLSQRLARTSTQASQSSFASSTAAERPRTGVWKGVHHVALLCEDLERSLDFYCGVLGLEVNPDRPHDKLPYSGAWLWIGPEMIHLMELPNPDPLDNRPEHGGRDRHFCVGVADLDPIVKALEASDIAFTMSMSGRRAAFFRDPDMNCLEIVETDEPWR